MGVGDKIRLLRKEKKITQKQLAALSGIAEITIRQYEAGKYSPKFEQLQKISNALGVPIVDFISSEETEGIDEQYTLGFFAKYLESLGYKFKYVSARENEEGKLVEYENGGYVDGKVILPDNKRRLPSITKSGVTKIMTQTEFYEFRKSIRSFIDFQFSQIN